MFRIGIAMILCSAQLAASAEDFKFYIGGAPGYSLFSVNGKELSSGAAPTPFLPTPGPINAAVFTSVFPAGISPYTTATTLPVINTIIDDEEFGWKIYGGYHLNPYLGIEIGYADLGAVRADSDYSYSRSIPSVPPLNVPGTITTNAITNVAERVTGVFLAGSGRYPVSEKVSVLGKVGAYTWQSLLEVNLSIQSVLTNATTPAVPTNTATVGPFSSLLEDDGIGLMFGLGAEYMLTERITVRGEWERFNDIRIGGNWVDMFSLGMSYHFDVM